MDNNKYNKYNNKDNNKYNNGSRTINNWKQQI